MSKAIHKAHKGYPRNYETRLIGYARVSTDEQDLRMQTEALLKAGVHPDNIWTDKKSGKNLNRRGLDAALLDARRGDVIVVWRLDRLARSLKDLIYLFERLGDDGINVRSLHENIDTTTPMGKFIFHLTGALAEFERGMTSFRTKKGIETSQKRGTKFGPKPKLSEADVEKAVKWFKQKKSTKEIAKKLRVSVVTLRDTVEKQTGKKYWPHGPHSKR